MGNNIFIQKAIEIHKDSLGFSKTNFNGDWNEKVIVTCPIHGDFEITAKHLIYTKQGCKSCKKDKERLSLDEVKERIKNIHGDKYGLDKINYKNNKTPIILTCPIHGDFTIMPQSIFQQHAGCKECGYNSMKYKNMGTKEDFVSQARIIFNDDYDYTDSVYQGNKVKLKIKCNKCGYIFEVTPNNHLNNNSGCPRCNQSKLESLSEHFLKDKKISFSSQKKFDWLKYKKIMSLDFYLNDYNIAIECQGEQHFKLVDFANKGKEWANKQFEIVQHRDKEKLRLCEEHGINIYYYSDLKEYNEFLGKKLYHDLDELISNIEKENLSIKETTLKLFN